MSPAPSYDDIVKGLVILITRIYNYAGEQTEIPVGFESLDAIIAKGVVFGITAAVMVSMYFIAVYPALEDSIEAKITKYSRWIARWQAVQISAGMVCGVAIGTAISFMIDGTARLVHQQEAAG